MFTAFYPDFNSGLANILKYLPFTCRKHICEPSSVSGQPSHELALSRAAISDAYQERK